MVIGNILIGLFVKQELDLDFCALLLVNNSSLTDLSVHILLKILLHLVNPQFTLSFLMVNEHDMAILSVFCFKCNFF